MDLPPPIIYVDESYQDWSDQDTQRQMIMVGLQVTDCLQTRRAVVGAYRERNPLLGEKPSKEKINLLCGVAIAGHYWISKNLSKRKRKIFQNISLLVEGFFVDDNFSVGANIGF